MGKKLFIASAFTLSAILMILLFTVPISAEEYDTLPPEYAEYTDSISGSIKDKLPEGVFSENADEINEAAAELISPVGILKVLTDALGAGLANAAPTLSLVLGIVILSAVLSTVSADLGGMSRAVENCIRLCTFTAISTVAVGCAEALTVYFERLFMSVASFLPLSAVLYAMGGNIGTAASSGATLGVTLTVCQFFCTNTVIPIFCICLCMSLLSVFDGQGAAAGSTLSASLRRWYMTSLSFVMMILTCSVAGSAILSSKADSMAMRGAKFAVSSFVPVSGGTVSSTLGTLAASVEMLRGSVGVIGIAVIILMLLPTVIELALLRGVFTIGSFCASTLGCSGEARLLSHLEALYGYLEGIAALSAAVFIISFGIFASISTPF